MRIRSPGMRLAVVLLSAACAAPALASGDVLIMPYKCTMTDGKPTLTPSRDEEGYRIVSKRESRKVETCSTVQSNHCRQWTVFKFDMDCGGTRVPWMQVFANASEHTRRRVWVTNGRLRVADTRMRNKRLDDLCARRMGPQMDWDTLAERCEEVSTINSPTSTNMPEGFAPMVGLEAAILPAERAERLGLQLPEAPPASIRPPTSSKPPRETAAIAPREPAKQPAAKTPSVVAKAQPVPATHAETPVNEPPPVPEVASPATDVPAQPDAAVTTQAPPPTVVETAAAPVADTSAEPQPPVPPSASPAPSAAALEPAPSVAEQEPPAVSPDAGKVAQIAALAARQAAHTVPGAASPPPATVPTPTPEAAVIVADTWPPAEAAETPGPRGIPPLIATLAGALLTLTMLGVYWLSRPQPRSTAGATEFDDSRTPPSLDPLPQPEATQNALALRRDASSRLEPQLDGPRLPTREPLIGNRMPVSRREALEILGMGVPSDGNLASLKKIIDGLRMNWHPDHAVDDADRIVREMRTKQINAAWDLLRARANAEAI